MTLDIMTRNEVAQFLSISPQRVWQLIKQGALKPERHGATYIFDAKEVRALRKIKAKHGEKWVNPEK